MQTKLTVQKALIYQRVTTNPQLIFYVDCVEEKFHNISLRRARSCRGPWDLRYIKFGYFLLSAAIRILYKLLECYADLYEAPLRPENIKIVTYESVKMLMLCSGDQTLLKLFEGIPERKIEETWK